MKTGIHYLLFCAVLSFQPAEAAGQTECLGRLQFTLPSAAEVAGASFDEMKQQIQQPYNTPRYRFSDGEEPWSSRIFFNGPLLISNQMNREQLADLIKTFGTGHKLEATANAYSWNAGRATRMLLNIDSHLLLVNVAAGESLAANKAMSAALAKNLATRSIASIPKEEGLCLPYAFIRTDKFERRHISATYKLLDHPEVTIWISETSSTAQSDAVGAKNAISKHVINNFWSQYETGRNVSKVEPMLPQKNGRAVKLAGQDGTASFVKISRKGGVEDFGYYASSRGEPGNELASDINLYIIRNSSFSKNKSPIDRDEFFRIAEAIEASLGWTH